MTDPSRTRVEAQLVVVTPTYAPDLDLFSDLHDSVLRWFPTDVRHLVVVNDSDVALFRRFEGPRCLVVGVGDVLPRSVRALPIGKLWVNLRRPVPPFEVGSFSSWSSSRSPSWYRNVWSSWLTPTSSSSDRSP